MVYRQKAASLPPLRVTPEFREAAESVLKEGETVSMRTETATLRTIRNCTRC